MGKSMRAVWGVVVLCCSLVLVTSGVAEEQAVVEMSREEAILDKEATQAMRGVDSGDTDSDGFMSDIVDIGDSKSKKDAASKALAAARDAAAAARKASAAEKGR